MYTHATLPTPVRMIPLAVLIFVILIGGLVAQLMLGLELPQPSPNPPLAQPVPLLETVSPLFTPEVRYWNDSIVRWAKDYDLDPNLVATVMQIESCGNPEAVSSSNAQGLFQVMPFHFVEGENMRDPDTNAKRGLAYLSKGLALSGDQAGLALAGYNGGHSQIAKAWSRWPNETQRYFYWGSGIYAEANAGADSSSRLAEWLKAGGAGMCARARQQLGLP
ncbi:MAG TPA: transglycosylase SLT domain-containing protein [Anaerolineales bacterium]|nr:transglycosylase SLT domain-containing protein [Anaerolineales bacterium]